MTSPRILAATTLLGLASTTAAFAATAPSFEEAPFLGRVSAGAAVRYDLDRTAAKATVTIDGKRATVRTTDKAEHLYTAFVMNGGFKKAGRSYKVTIKVTGADGSSRTFSRKLYLHRSLNAPK